MTYDILILPTHDRQAGWHSKSMKRLRSIVAGILIALAGLSLPSAWPGVATIYIATVVLNDAQIKALPTTPVELVPTPGPGKFIMPLNAILTAHLVSDYTNIHATRADIRVWDGGSGNMELCPALNAGEPDNKAHVTALLAPGVGPADRQTWMGFYAFYSATDLGTTTYTNAVPKANNEDKALLLRLGNDNGNLTGGNAANTLTVTVLYCVLSN